MNIVNPESMNYYRIGSIKLQWIMSICSGNRSINLTIL